jgi:penicillin-binding protein 1A
MTKLMQGVVCDGSARGLISLSDRIEVAGKTGTTQNTCDRYFIGYTPQLLAGAWFGYEYPKSLSEFGGNYAAVFWDEVMNKIYDETDFHRTRFKIPDGVVKQPYNKITGERASVFDSMDIIEEGWFFGSGKHNDGQ